MATFLILATIIAEVVAVSLLFPGTAIDNLRKLNEQAYREFGSIGSMTVGLFLSILGIVTAFASWGLLHGKRWAWWTAISIISLNGIGDILSLVVQHDLLKGGSGVVIAGVFLIMLLRPKSRAFFQMGDNP